MGGALKKRFTAMLEKVWDRSWNSPTLLAQIEATAREFGFSLGHTLAESIGFGFETHFPVAIKFEDLNLDFPVPADAPTLDPKFFDEISESTINWSKSLRDVSRAFKLVGVEADSTLGRIMGSMVVAASAGENLMKAFSVDIFDKDGKKIGEDIQFSWEGVTSAVLAAAEAVGAFMAATESASGGKRALGGAITGAQVGTSISPGYGTLIGAGVGALLGWLRKPGWVKQMEEIGESWGFGISGGLAQAIEETKKSLDLTDFQARILHLGDVIREMGGIRPGNLESIRVSFSGLLGAIRDGSVSAGDGLRALDDAFVAMANSFENAGVAGAKAMGDMIKKSQELGLVTQAMTDFIQAQTEAAIGHFAAFFDSFITGVGDSARAIALSAQEALDVINVIGIQFAVTLKSTGSLLEAIRLLPDAWETLRPVLAEIFGDQNELFNTISRYYNFVEANEGVILALEGISAGMLTVFSIGALTEAGAEALATAWVTQFDKMLLAVGDLDTAVLLLGPSAKIIFDILTEMGLKVPDSIKKIIERAEEMGTSLEPPPTTLSVLESIRDILHLIGEELGAIKAISIDIDTSSSTTTPPPDTIGEPAARGFAPTVFTKPRTFTFGEAGPEMVQAVPVGDIDAQGMAGGGGGPTISITFQGPVFGDEETFYSAVRQAVNEGLRHDHDDLRTETRIATGTS